MYYVQCGKLSSGSAILPIHAKGEGLSMEWGSHDKEWGRVCVGQAVRYRGHKCCSNRVSILLGVWSCGIMLRLSTENGGQRDWRGHAGKTLLLHTHIIQNSMCVYTEHHTPTIQHADARHTIITVHRARAW